MTPSEIASTARLLYTSYPEDARRLAETKETLRLARQAGDAAMMEDARHAYREYDALCRKWAGIVADLARALPGALPGLWPKLRIVQVGARWHDDEGHDWDAAARELRTVEAACLAAADEEAGEWSEPATNKTWEKRLGVRERTLREWREKGFQMEHVPGKRGMWRVNMAEPAYQEWAEKNTPTQ